jgi:hypothetical protein
VERDLKTRCLAYTLPTIWEVARRELGIPFVEPAQAPE